MWRYSNNVIADSDIDKIKNLTFNNRVEIKIGQSGGSTYYWATTRLLFIDNEKQTVGFVFSSVPSGNGAYYIVANYQYKSYVVKTL